MATDMSYAVEVPRKMQKQVARLPTDVQNRGDDWRIRVGHYRIFYEIHNASRELLFLDVWSRQRGCR